MPPSAADAMVAAGRSTWAQEPPPLQARKAGQVTFANGAQLPLPAMQPPVLQPPEALVPAAPDWQPVASLPSGPRSRPEAEAAPSALPAPRPLARSTPVQIAPGQSPGRNQGNELRRQAELRSLEFRRRWLIGNFY